MERDVVLYSKEERVLNGHATLLRDGEGSRVGVLVVLNDVTQLRRLENIRKDFVANVSHELKTPITSIKGFIETLSDGAIHDPADAKRFLDIVSRQTQRLNAIIDDLLMLSRIEQQTDRSEMELATGTLRPVIVAAVQLCQGKADEKEVSLQVRCPEDLAARMNAPLLEQAVVNLIDNAIKYSNPKSEVKIEAEKTPRDRRGPCGGLWLRNRAGVSAAIVRAVLPRGQGPEPKTGGDRAGPGDRQTHPPRPMGDG